ncbi:MAG: peptidoglycan D,D-transpeptidase FtsI family protein [Planctomycetota bacterium]
MFHARLKLSAAAILAAMVLVILRLGYMQLLMADHYREQGRRRQVRVLFPDAPRGAILARDGSVLAEDRPILSVCVLLKDIDGVSPPPGRDSAFNVKVKFRNVRPLAGAELENWCAGVAAAVGDSVDGVMARLEDARDRIEADIAQNSRRILAGASADDPARRKEARLEERILRRTLPAEKPQPLYEDVPFEVAARSEAVTADYPGLCVTESMRRKYPDPPLAAPVVGYMSAATARDYDLYRYEYNGDKAKRVFFHDTMGRTGIEKRFNFELRGSRGRREEIINAAKQVQKVLHEELPQRGATVVLTIDPELQRAAERALAKAFADLDCPGAAVCLDAMTGDVLALASFPSFDPNTISEDLADLVNPEGFGRYSPLLNRAVAGVYPLGSVFKVVTTSAGLQSGAISQYTSFTCPGYYRLGRNRFLCWIHRAPRFGSHGTLELINALKVSCNVYFFNAGRAAGGSALAEWALRYGFGRPAGIGLPGEQGGRVPITRYPGDVVNLSIGQGPLLVTPLQVARMIAAVANGGRLVTPRILLQPSTPLERRVGLSPSTLEALRTGLSKVVSETGGTGYRTVRSRKITISGKTGTAQAPPGGDHAWFAGFAPSDDPKIAFAVVIEHGGHGGAAAGPVAKAIAEAWASKKEAP